MKITGLVLLLFGLFTAWGVWQPWYSRFYTARVWFRTFGKQKAQRVLTVIGIGFVVVGALMLCGVIPR
jgi:hypothetical protein